MASRIKEDEKNEKIIRGLLKHPANKRCINCNSLGPQYVCTNFWTFVCTSCGGIHREFTHRVKSISMAKFTSQEVSALQGGGNERAKEFYFKEWDPQRHSIPDGSNVERLRDFIKHVYVDRRYTGERSTDRPPRVKGDDTYRGDSRSPPYEDTYGSRYNERSGPGGRNDDMNPRYSYDEKRSPGYGDIYKKSPGRFEGVDDRRREERFGNGNQNRRFDEQRLSDGSSKQEERSPNHQRDLDASSPPMVRPVRDILGDDIPPLRVGDPPKSNGRRSTEVSAHTRRTASSSSMGSADGNPVELKRADLGSLIDFNADPEPPAVAVPPDPFSSQSVPQPTAKPSIDDGNWASFDFVTQEKAPQPLSNAPTLTSGLSQLASPAAPAGWNTASSVGGLDYLLQPTAGGPWPVMQQQQQPQPQPPSLFSMPVSAAPNNQPWISSVAPNAQIPITVQTGYPSQVASKPSQETIAGAPTQPPPVEAKQTGRIALPEDLFTAVPVLAPGWQAVPHQGMGFGMQYSTAMLQTVPTYVQLPKSSNPFDVINEPAQVHGPMFPSMVSLQGALPNVAAPPSFQGALQSMGPSPSLQGALPNMAHPSMMRTSSFGNPSSQWIPTQPSSYPAPLPQSAYMAQQAANSIPPLGRLGSGSFAGAGAAFGPFGANQRPTPGGSQPSTPNSFSPSLGGNPFG